MDFEIYFFIFFKLDDFKIPFEILRILNMPIVKKVTLRSKIVLQPKETIHVRIDYTGLPKSRSFIITRIYPTVLNIILDFTTFKITILINFTKKVLKIDKSI